MRSSSVTMAVNHTAIRKSIMQIHISMGISTHTIRAMDMHMITRTIKTMHMHTTTIMDTRIHTDILMRTDIIIMARIIKQGCS